MKILFFPSDLGGGFGHISRCLALANEAKKRGHSCAFVLNDRKYEKLIKVCFCVFVLPTYPGLYRLYAMLKKTISVKPYAAPLFTEISGLDFQVVRDGLTSRKIITKKLTQYHEIVKRFNPHIIVGDTNLLLWMLSKKAHVPLVQIVRFALHPETANLIWWKKRPEGIVAPDSAALFNPLLAEMGLTPIKRAEDLMQGDLYIIPSIPEIEPVAADEKTVHVGDLTVSESMEQEPAWFGHIDNSRPLVYVTIGGGAGPVGNKLFFSTIVDAFSDKPIQVIVSTSEKYELQDLPAAPENIRYFKWVPGKLMISKADLVVFHGGYGTMMETVACGKPTITIPYQTEQEGNGRRLEQLGCGLVNKLSREKYKPVNATWEMGKYTFLVQTKYELKGQELLESVEEVLHNNKYKENTSQIQSRVKEYQGAAKAMNLIEKHGSNP
jgi:UDP:flavonoid glycosyltransferase YjiC (YdhE family)